MWVVGKRVLCVFARKDPLKTAAGRDGTDEELLLCMRGRPTCSEFGKPLDTATCGRRN